MVIMIKSSNASCQTDPVKKELAAAAASSDKEVQDGEQGKRKNERKRKRTSFRPRIQVLRFVEDEGDSEELGDGKAQEQEGIKVECQMGTDPKTVIFEFHTTKIGPKAMANCFIRENLLAEKHKQFFVEQLVEIGRQLKVDPATLPQVNSPLNRARSPDSSPCDEEGSKEQRDEKEEANITPVSPPCASPPIVNKQNMRSQIFHDVCFVLILIGVLLFLYGPPWVSYQQTPLLMEPDDNFLFVLNCGMTTMSLVIMMIIMDKLWFYCKQIPEMKCILMIPIMAIYIFVMPLCIVYGLSLLRNINIEEWGWEKGIALFILAVFEPGSFYALHILTHHTHVATEKSEKSNSSRRPQSGFNKTKAISNYGAINKIDMV